MAFALSWSAQPAFAPDGSPGIGHNGGPRIELPAKIIPVFANPDGSYRHTRYKVLYGGRGGAKSWAVARLLVGMAAGRKLRILCAREFQVSIADSVHKLLCDQVESLGLSHLFDITDRSIVCLVTGSEFIFKGLKRNIREIKSLEGIDLVWVEEAQAVSKESWQILIPTIRKAGSEIWVTFNPDGDEDATWERFLGNPDKGIKPPPDHMIAIQKVNWSDNPWFGGELEMERLADLNNDDPDAYQWIWEGDIRRISDALIFRRRVEVRPFLEPTDPPPSRIYFGQDWGFANDPNAAIRFYITEAPSADVPGHTDQFLWITHEAYAWQMEIDDIPTKLLTEERLPGVSSWPIKADSARPETISYVRRRGYTIDAAEKWPGSVEDGIEHLKGFKKIIIHERCQHIAREARLYAYKVDPNNGDVLPVIVDKHNHGWDAVRYGLDGVIQHRGGHSMWAKLAT